MGKQNQNRLNKFFDQKKFTELLNVEKMSFKL